MKIFIGKKAFRALFTVFVLATPVLLAGLFVGICDGHLKSMFKDTNTSITAMSIFFMIAVLGAFVCAAKWRSLYTLAPDFLVVNQGLRSSRIDRSNVKSVNSSGDRIVICYNDSEITISRFLLNDSDFSSLREWANKVRTQPT